MSYKRLYYFYILAQQLNYSEASKKIGIKQPTLSQQINLLENEMNVRLFYRNSKKVMLTTAGERLFHKMAEMKENLDEVIGELGQEKPGAKTLLIGVIQGELTDLISNVMIAFKTHYPDVHCVLHTMDMSLSLLEKGEFDLYFDYDTTGNKDNMTFLYQDHFNIIHSKSMGSPNISELSQYQWVLMSRRYSCRLIFEKLSDYHGFTITPAMELSDLSVVYNMVNNNMGISLVSDTSLSFYNRENLNLLKVREPLLNRNVVMHHNGDPGMNEYLEAFYNLTMNELKKLNIIR